MAAANALITMKEVLMLSSLGINPQFITLTHVTMESDKYLCVWGDGSTEQCCNHWYEYANAAFEKADHYGLGANESQYQNSCIESSTSGSSKEWIWAVLSPCPLFLLACFPSIANGWIILEFLVTYSWVLGIVFISVGNDRLRRTTSFMGTVWDGSRLRSRRLSGFILMRWAVRDGMTQLLGLWLFGEIEDQYSFFKLFVRLKLMPFSVMLPRIRGFEKEIYGLLFTWFLWDIMAIQKHYYLNVKRTRSACMHFPISMCIKKGNRIFNRRKALIEGSFFFRKDTERIFYFLGVERSTAGGYIILLKQKGKGERIFFKSRSTRRVISFFWSKERIFWAWEGERREDFWLEKEKEDLLFFWEQREVSTGGRRSSHLFSMDHQPAPRVRAG